MKNIFYKSMHVYNLHRSDKLDHENGRPAILLWFKFNKSLVWIGTSHKDNKSNENPLILLINNKKTYFYSSGIERIETKYLISHWIDYSNKNKGNESKSYNLNNIDQKFLISKFITFTKEKNLYLEIKNLKEKIKKLETEIELLKNRNRG